MILRDRAAVKAELREKIKAAVRPTTAQLEAAVRDDIGIEEKTVHIGVVLIAATHVGAKAPAIAEFTGYDIEEVRAIVRKAYETGVFGPKGELNADWYRKRPKGISGVSFCLDVMAVIGITVRVGADGKPYRGTCPADAL